jgi:hypothetical protein
MFESVDAVRFDRKMGIGRTRPLLLACDGPHGEFQVVAKFSAGCSRGGLIREALTAMLALDLGLPVPAPFLVHLSPQFIESIPDAGVADFLRKGDHFGFGSTLLPAGFGAWVPPAGRMTDLLESQALHILALDCWLTNGDRIATNHNLLTNGKEFAIFDHELALMTTLNLFWKEPWQVDSLQDARPPVDHVFFGHLRRRAAYSTEDICSRLQSLTDARIAEYVNALPASWASEVETIHRAQTFIRALRNNAASAATELKRVLT